MENNVIEINQNYHSIQHQDGLNQPVASISGAENRRPLGNNSRRKLKDKVEWTLADKARLVEIDNKERTKGKGFMNRVKTRWDNERKSMTLSKQSLRDNAARFRKEGEVITRIQVTTQGNSQHSENEGMEEVQLIGQKGYSWKTTEKVRLVQINEQEKSRGRGFMQRVKDIWDSEFPELTFVSKQSLKDNAARFQKDPEIMNAVLVKRRYTEGDETGGADVHVFIEGSVVTEGRDNVNENQQQGYVNETTEIDEEVHEPLEKDRQLEQIFEEELSKLKPICDITDEPREKLLKVKITSEKEQSANRILFWKLRQIADVGQIVDAVYAMGLALIRSMGVKRKAPGQGKKNGNRRERKITNKMKELRQWIARAGNEIYRRKTRRRATVTR